MVSPDEVVRCVRIDAEMKPMFYKVLANMDDEPGFPHVFLEYPETFTEPLEYFGGLLEFITEEYQQNKSEFVENDVNVTFPPVDENNLKEPAKFLQYAQAISESLPDSLGSLVFLLDPEEVEDRDSYRKSFQYLSTRTKSKWLKFLVLDKRMDPDLPDPFDEEKSIVTQIFHLGPEEMERRAADDIKSPGAMSTVQGRQTLGLLAGFATANKEHGKALELQNKWVEEAGKKGEPSERAQAYYNLGNTHLDNETYSEATDAYCKACNLCVENQLDSLAPFVYTNLGVSLHRQDAFEQAFDSLRVARDMFRAQKQLPGEVHVVDTLAGMYAIDGDNDKAEKTWFYALELYEGITSSAFSDLRENGIEDICGKLERFYQDTNQAEKIKALQNRKNEANGSCG